MTDTATRDVTAEVTAWLEENWDPDITVREWWERLGLSGWGTPTWPVDKYGQGLSRAEGVMVGNAIAEFGALGPPGGLGLLLAGPTINDHGTPEQIKEYVEDIVTGRKAWCQLFSEPGAGSDLAGLTCKAIKDGDEYIITGQKVWTSGGQIADMGMLIARTNVEVPKHQGITWFSFDMHQDGVDVRPLREMTGHAMFNEVYLDEARVHEDAVIGGLHNGWAVANTTLMHERSGLGAGGGNAAGGFASPGTIAKDLDKRVGDFVSGGGRRSRGGGGGGGMFGAQSKLLIDLAKGNGKISDPTIRQDLMRLHTLNELGRMQNLRIKGGGTVPGAPNIAKLQMSNIVRMSRDVGLAIVGPYGTLHGYTQEQTEKNNDATGNPFAGMVTGTALYAQAPPIYGGTDQVQRNIIGERVLGLPKEANNDKTAAFKDLPKNA
ncbi:MAG TPA: acyl-CoA dehydrogenase family protein [Acidimicrobiales bacterium]|nr:acyl-CoA dehydrogenase family protein [Acidimicrobiales bacterium]